MLRGPDENESLQAAWKWSFELEAEKTSHTFLAPSKEERDLWVSCINRFLLIPVRDPTLLNSVEVFQLDLVEI